MLQRIITWDMEAARVTINYRSEKLRRWYSLLTSSTSASNTGHPVRGWGGCRHSTAYEVSDEIGRLGSKSLIHSTGTFGVIVPSSSPLSQRTSAYFWLAEARTSGRLLRLGAEPLLRETFFDIFWSSRGGATARQKQKLTVKLDWSQVGRARVWTRVYICFSSPFKTVMVGRPPQSLAESVVPGGARRQQLFSKQCEFTDVKEITIIQKTILNYQSLSNYLAVTKIWDKPSSGSDCKTIKTMLDSWPARPYPHRLKLPPTLPTSALPDGIVVQDGCPSSSEFSCRGIYCESYLLVVERFLPRKYSALDQRVCVPLIRDAYPASLAQLLYLTRLGLNFISGHPFMPSVNRTK